MAVIAGEPIGPVLATPTASDQDALILRILKAVETHDYRTLLVYTLDKETDYFGHKNSSNAFIQQDMTQDARSYISGAGLFQIYPLFRLRSGMTQLNMILMHSMFEAKSTRRDVVLTFITRLRLHPDCKHCP